MKAPGIHPALWLLMFTMLLPMLSGDIMFPRGVKRQLCESGRLGVICNQPVKKGFCTYSFYRYYFNKDTALCEPFIFTGCGGNRNNFKSKYICEVYCINIEVSLLLSHSTFKDTASPLEPLFYRQHLEKG
uniref:amyloid-beta A4 protein-like n=1 Tax=Arvicanthis niloticus TaxID=61156 RepID=UPI0014863C65|nr:amyloid-beta A4 protein-like [Arvicanthis niloticus]